MHLAVRKEGTRVAVRTAGPFAVKDLFATLGRGRERAIAVAKRIGWGLELAKVRQQRVDVLAFGWRAEHRFREGLAHGGARVALPAVPRPRARLVEVVQRQHGLIGVAR